MDENLINKIAAGEVIERPASVVKELVENSLDAHPTQISIEIKNSGRELIRVADDGTGMDKDDAKKSILRHATSKISSETDLFSISTLGFRGEALASIAAVSQLSIITKPADQIEAFNLVVEAGEIVSSGILAAEKGTIVEVQNLFFNVPARKKFLKTDAVELRHIVDVVLRYALINPNIAFKLTHEGHQLLNSPAVDGLKNNIASVYGIKLAKELLEVNYEMEGVKAYGYAAKPHQARNDKTQQMIYVNGRWVRNEEITKAVYEAYHSLLFIGKHPIFILSLDIDPQKIDVNVHPQKTEIKFEQKNTVFNVVFTAVKETLEKNNLIPILDFETEQQLSFGASANGKANRNAVRVSPSLSSPPFELSTQDTLKSESSQAIKDAVESEEYATPEEEVLVPERWKEHLISEKIPPLRVLGQIHKTFFVAEAEDGIMLIDQHVVQERVLYEKFMGQLMNKKVAVQELLRGEMLDFTPSEAVLLKDNLSELKLFGFYLESFGENTYLLKTVPSVFGRMQPKELVYDLLDSFKGGKNKLEQVQEAIITRMACRSSIKAGDEMTVTGMQALLEELANCRLPYTCPHGRSVMIKITVDELEKKFMRK